MAVRPDWSTETWNCWEGAPIAHAAFQSEQDPVPFCLGPGEGLRGCRKVLIKLKVTQGKQLLSNKPAASGITAQPSWEARSEWREQPGTDMGVSLG